MAVDHRTNGTQRAVIYPVVSFTVILWFPICDLLLRIKSHS